MDVFVRRLTAAEIDGAFRMAYDTFMEFEAPDYSAEGVETFRRDVINNAEFRARCESGENPAWGAFNGNVLVGMVCMRKPCHIVMAFINRQYIRKGIGSTLFRRVIADIRRDFPEAKRITLNSSPYGRSFYHHVGFIDTDRELTQGGIRYTPMEYLL